jgi:AcrR family transcriptional regulator
VDASNSGWQGRVLARLATPTTEAATERALSVAQRVVDAARELLLETGGPSFTVPELAKRARTSLATLYSYFSGKDEVLLAVIEGAARSSRTSADPELELLTDPVARLQRVVQRPILRTGEVGGHASLIFFREAWRLAEIYPETLRTLTDPATMLLQTELDSAVAAGIAVSNDTYRDATSIRLFVWARIQAMQVGWGDDFQAVADDAWEFCSRALAIRQPSPAL